MKWDINITLRHLNISGWGDISHGISPRIPISASLTNGKHFSTHSKQLISVHLDGILQFKTKLTETIFALGLRLSCQTTMKLGKMHILKQIQSLDSPTEEEKIYLIKDPEEIEIELVPEVN